MKLNDLRMSSFIVATYILLIYANSDNFGNKRNDFLSQTQKGTDFEVTFNVPLEYLHFPVSCFLRFTLVGSTDHFKTEIVLLSNFTLVFS